MTAPAATTPRVVTIWLPLPPSVLNPNSRASWRDRARATKEYRQSAYYIALAALFPARASFENERMQRAELAIRYVVCVNNRLGLRGRAQPVDDDNCIATLKSGRDGALVDSRLLPNDSADHLRITGCQVERHAKGRCPASPCPGSRVVFTVTEVLP